MKQFTDAAVDGLEYGLKVDGVQMARKGRRREKKRGHGSCEVLHCLLFKSTVGAIG